VNTAIPADAPTLVVTQKMKDGTPFGVALLREASSHLMLRWLKTVVVL
jgi:hypothetical protein